MTTKPPSSVEPAPADSLERIAYGSVEGFPVSEPHDRDRLGYSIWLWLTERKNPLEIAVRTAGAHLLINEKEAVDRISAYLAQKGIAL